MARLGLTRIGLVLLDYGLQSVWLQIERLPLPLWPAAVLVSVQLRSVPILVDSDPVQPVILPYPTALLQSRWPDRLRLSLNPSRGHRLDPFTWFAIISDLVIALKRPLVASID